MQHQPNRRDLLRRSAGLAAAAWLPPVRRRPANERLNLGVIGVANRGAENLAEVSGENIVALCDVDDQYLAAAGARFPGARRHHDFRRLLDQKDVEAVLVATPDHTHAIATILALESGRPVYCEKPLTHTVAEARRVVETARRTGLATQMGTQIHAGANYRRVVELIQAGAIGKVRAAHCWVGKSWAGGARPADAPPVPPHLHWDLWLGPAPQRPFHPAYVPGAWRGFWAFGAGTLGDMGCHHLDLPFWALGLRHPQRIAARGPERDGEAAPPWLEVHWRFPDLDLYWHDGGRRPPQFAAGEVAEWGDGTLFVGERGLLLADYDRHLLLPEADFRDYAPPPPSIPDSIGHHREWLEACKQRGPTTCNFDYAGALTECVLLGTVAYRAGAELEWDPGAMQIKNHPAAAALLASAPRRGWEF